MDLVIVFFLLGSFSLFRLVYEDFKTRLVDERVSYYMFGVVATIFLLKDLLLFWLVFTVFLLFALTYIKDLMDKRHYNFIGKGDLTIISWLIPSLFVLNVWWGITYTILYCTSNILAFEITKQNKIPGTITMFIALQITWILQQTHLI